jgi:hypothetical protein
MSQKTLSNPTIEVNDDVIAIVPNSFVYKKGKGNKGVKSQSSGGDAIETVITEDAETKKSMCKFKLYHTAKNVQLIDDWQSNFSNTINASEDQISIPFRNMVITVDPERPAGADADIEIEWEGDPVL